MAVVSVILVAVVVSLSGLSYLSYVLFRQPPTYAGTGAQGDAERQFSLDPLSISAR